MGVGISALCVTHKQPNLLTPLKPAQPSLGVQYRRSKYIDVYIIHTPGCPLLLSILRVLSLPQVYGTV